MTHPHLIDYLVPQAILTRSGKINTADASVNTAVKPVNTADSKPTVNHPRLISNAYKIGHSQVTRPFNKHMTRNKCYLTEYEDYDGGFVSFGDGKDETVYKEWEDRMERAATTASSLDAEQDSGAKYQNGEVDAQTSTLENGEIEITATIDGKVKVVSEASIRRHLKLEDSDGISTLPNAKIFEQLALMGPKKTAWEQFSSNIATAIFFLATNRTFNYSKLIFEAMGKGSTIPVESYHTPTSAPSTSQPPTSSPSMQTTHVALIPHDSPILRVHSHRSDEGSLTLNELTILCTQLSTKVISLEEDLKQTKKVYGNAYAKLILKVKKLEKNVKTSQARRRAKIVVSDDEEDEEDSSKQGRSLVDDMDLDAGISLVPPHVVDQGRFDDTHVSDQPEEQLGVFSATKVLADAARIRRGVENVHTYTRRRTVSNGSGLVSTAGMAGVSTAGMAQEVEINIPSPVAAKDKGKAVMQESEPPKKIKKRVQIQMSIDEELAQKLHEEEQARFNAEQEAKFNEEQEKERLDYEAAVRIQEELDESERQRMLKVAVDEDLVQQLQPGEKYSEENLPRKLVELVNQRKKFFAQQRIGEASGSVQEQSDEEPKADELSQEQLQKLMIIVPEEGMNVEALQTKDDLVKLWSLVHERFNSTELTDDKAKELWVELKRLFEPDENDTLWKIQRYMHDPLTWKLYDTCGVHHVSTDRG
ncbi:hypothetical protein Tco_0763770 [Tanacetum coccineum]